MPPTSRLRRLNFRMMYYESRGESISGLLKQQWPVPIQPMKAVEIELRNSIDRSGPDTSCMFEVTLNNISEGDIQLSNFRVSVDPKSPYKVTILEPASENISLNLSESYAVVIGFLRVNTVGDSGKGAYLGVLSFNFSFLNRDNDKGFLEVKMDKPGEELKLLKLVPCKKSDLMLKYQSVSETKFLLSNIHDKDLFIRLDKNHKDSSALSVHKIIVDAPVRGSGNYEVKAGDFIEVKLIVFAKVRGVFVFDFIKVFGLINRQTTVIEYSAPSIIIE